MRPQLEFQSVQLWKLQQQEPEGISLSLSLLLTHGFMAKTIGREIRFHWVNVNALRSHKYSERCVYIHFVDGISWWKEMYVKFMSWQKKVISSLHFLFTDSLTLVIHF